MRYVDFAWDIAFGIAGPVSFLRHMDVQERSTDFSWFFGLICKRRLKSQALIGGDNC